MANYLKEVKNFNPSSQLRQTETKVTNRDGTTYTEKKQITAIFQYKLHQKWV